MKKILLVLFLLMASFQAAAQTNFVIPYDQPRRFPSQIRNSPAYVNTRVLAANVAKTITPPASARFVVFSGNCNFFVKMGGATAVVPADTTDGTSAELNPSAYYLNPAAQSISVITADPSCIVTAAFYLGPVN